MLLENCLFECFEASSTLQFLSLLIRIFKPPEYFIRIFKVINLLFHIFIGRNRCLPLFNRRHSFCQTFQLLLKLFIFLFQCLICLLFLKHILFSLNSLLFFVSDIFFKVYFGILIVLLPWNLYSCTFSTQLLIFLFELDHNNLQFFDELGFVFVLVGLNIYVTF